MNFLDAAFRILQDAQEPLHYAEICRRAIKRSLIVPKGQTPEATMGSRLYVDTKKPNSRFRRAARGIFALVEKAQTEEVAKRVEAINGRTRKRLHKLLHDMPADRFEALIGELLLSIGFEEDSVEVTSYSGDGGIDVRGILNAGDITQINAAVQVKRWKNNIQATTVRNVRGSLTTQEQGIIITTSDYSKGAKQEANAIGKTPISLINGQELLDLLLVHSIGVNMEQHTVMSLDDDYWGELIGSPAEPEPEKPAPQPTAVKVKYPLTVQAMNNTAITAQLLNANGQMSFNGEEYGSPSAAGKEASGWKSCNGWHYWRFQHPKTMVWRPIDDLRHHNNS